MSGSLHRFAAILRADVMVRLRRPSTAVVFLLISITPYMWIPDPSTGRTLMQIGGSRVLYNSAAIGMGTAVLGTLFIGLVGFYVISNALRRDVESRCGFVIASTTMRGGEYILGKFAGNVAFLSIFTLGFMTTAMAMVLVRGEAPLQPHVFALQYLILLPPSIVFCSAIAIVFESTPLLRTKFGDVLYFFLWLGLMGSVAGSVEKGAGNWTQIFDVSGLGFLMQQMQTIYDTSSLSIGSSTFDAAKAPLVFEGLQARASWFAPRLATTLWPMSLLVIARIFFHRFDPARVRAARFDHSRRTWLGRLNLLSKPVARVLVAAGSFVQSLPAGLLRSAGVDALATIGSFPLAAVAIVGLAIATLASGSTALFTGVLPFAFAACAIAVAEIACREKRSATTALVFAAPALRAGFVFWKYLSTLFVALAFLALPIARAIALRPSSALALLTGALFVTAAATALGIVSANPKTFIVGFLMFWYVVLSDKGHSPSLDFAGWFGTATPSVSVAYAVSSLALLAGAHLFHAWDLRRRW